MLSVPGMEKCNTERRRDVLGAWHGQSQWQGQAGMLSVPGMGESNTHASAHFTAKVGARWRRHQLGHYLLLPSGEKVAMFSFQSHYL